MDGAFVGSDENSQFDKIARRPLSHIRVLRGTTTSVWNANLDARQRGPEDGRRPPAGVRHKDVPHNLSRRPLPHIHVLRGTGTSMCNAPSNKKAPQSGGIVIGQRLPIF